MNENTKVMIATIGSILLLSGLAFLWESTGNEATGKQPDLAQGVCAALLSLTAASSYILVAAMPEEKKSIDFFEK